MLVYENQVSLGNLFCFVGVFVCLFVCLFMGGWEMGFKGITGITGIILWVICRNCNVNVNIYKNQKGWGNQGSQSL